MPRKHLIKTNLFPYHIYGRTNNKEPFPIALSHVWKLCIKYFSKTYHLFNHQIYAFVLMPNHFHLLIKTPESNINEIMNYWLRELSKSISFRSDRVNHIFGGPYKWCLIQDAIYYSNIYRYIYRNPVKAKICPTVQLYEYSTLQKVINPNLDIPFDIFDQEYILLSEAIPKKIPARLTWLNTDFNNKQYSLINNGLKRSTFSYSKNNSFHRERNFLLKNPLGI